MRDLGQQTGAKRTTLTALVCCGLLLLALTRCDGASWSVSGSLPVAVTVGVTEPLDVELQNYRNTSISVSDLKVSIQRVTAPRADLDHPCTRRDFVVDQVSHTAVFTVAPRTASTMSSLGIPRASWPRIGLRDLPHNQDGCKEASLTLLFTASGRLGS